MNMAVCDSACQTHQVAKQPRYDLASYANYSYELRVD